MTFSTKVFKLALIGFGALFIACEKKEATKQETNQTTAISTSSRHQAGLQIKAKLVEIPGPFPANDLYNYVYVMRYEIKQVLAGEFSGKDILVGQYNPRIPRAEIKDDRDAIVDGNDVTNAKPDPEVFLRAAKLLNVENQNAIVFEDSVAGIQAANAAKMTSIGIGEEEILHEAQYIFKDFTFIEVSFIEALIN